MVYLKKYKRNRKFKIKKIFFIFVVVFVIIFESALLITNKLKGDNYIGDTSVENKIENATKYIVGISKDNVVVKGQTSSWGSGIVVSKNGYVLTNAHVCGERNSQCYIIMDGNNYCKGNVVWTNFDVDLAVIKAEITFNSCINLGDSDNLRLAQNVYTIGNPINTSFQKSVGKGVVSGLYRNLEFEEDGKRLYMTNLIQTDAVINYGNSGGALIDETGNLVGINTIKISDAELMGFAIPINIAKPIVKSFEQSGTFEEASLKVWCYDRYSINETNMNKKIVKGVLVAQIVADSNAEKAGLKVGDIITYIDTHEINTVNDLKEYVFSKNVGDNIILKINRDNHEFLVNLKLESV